MKSRDKFNHSDDPGEKQCYLESGPSRKKAWLRRLAMVGILGLLLWLFSGQYGQDRTCLFCQTLSPDSEHRV